MTTTPKETTMITDDSMMIIHAREFAYEQAAKKHPNFSTTEIVKKAEEIAAFLLATSSDVSA